MVILSLKNLRKEPARVEDEVALGSVSGGFRERRLLNADQFARLLTTGRDECSKIFAARGCNCL